MRLDAAPGSLPVTMQASWPLLAMSRILVPGQTYGLVYPTHNRFGLPLEFIERRVHVLSVADCAAGIPAKRLIKFPLVRRGRHLITGIDQDTLAKRYFWLEAQSRHNSDLPEYRLGLYDPSFPGELVDWVGRIFGPTEHEQLRMRRVAMRWYSIVRDRGGIGLRLAAYPWRYDR